MMECRDTGLPMMEGDVFKAFCSWRTNAKEFAKHSGLGEDYPVQVAQAINAANPSYTSLMSLAMLMSVPDPAWTVIENRFGKPTVEKLDEAWKHVRTGYTYAEQASDDVKGLAMGAAIVAFDQFGKMAESLGATLSVDGLGHSPQEILRKLTAPDCKMYARLEDKMHGTAYPELEKAYAAKLGEYLDARKEVDAQMEEMGMNSQDDRDDREIDALTFEQQGLMDAPEVRAAYSLLMQDTRVGTIGLANALSMGRLMSDLSERKDPAVIAAGMVDTGIPHRTADDAEFLAKKLPADVMDILNTYKLGDACLHSAAHVAEAPPAVRQLVVAKGIVALDWARKQSEGVMEYLSQREDSIGPQASALLKAESLEPLQVLAAMIPKALAPILNKTGSHELDQIFDAHLKDINRYVEEHTPQMPSGMNGSRVPGRGRPSGPDFGI